MADTYTNPDPRLHVDYLKSQYKIAHTILRRAVNEENFEKAEQIEGELKILVQLISKKEHAKA